MKSPNPRTGRPIRHFAFVILTIGITAAAAGDAAGAPDNLKTGVEDFADFLLKYFVALAAVGALSMAIIELWKKIRDSRTRYHAKSVVNWLKDTPYPEALSELLHLTTGMSRSRAKSAADGLYAADGSLPYWFGLSGRLDDALFSLELDQMLGHVQDAVDVAMTNPSLFPNLYALATTGADPADAEYWKTAAETARDVGDMDAAESKRRADAFTRLHQIAKRKLDALQLYSGRKWVNWNQLWSNIVGAAVMLSTLVWMKHTGSWDPSYPSIILLSLTGGILSPVAKDIVIALKKVRGG